jgi:hypothetical protein
MVTFSIGRRAAAALLSMLTLAGVVCGCAATVPAAAPVPVSVRPATVSAGTGCPPSVTGGTAASTASTASTTAFWPAAGRASVPWRSVGRGWILADAARSGSAAGPGTVYLVSPGGQRYRLGPAPANAFLEDWSEDGTHALFLRQSLEPIRASVIVLDLQTGQAGSFPVYSATSYPTVSFSRPAGTAILVLAGAAGGGFLPLQQFSLTGARELCYPFPQAGTVDVDYQENANGTAIVFSTLDDMEVVSSAGQPVRALATQYWGRGLCQMLNWWNNDSVLADCSGQLLAFPLSGGPPEQLTTSRDRGSFLGAWHLPSGTYAEAAACGSTWLERLNPDGTATTLTVPGAQGGGRVQPLGADGGQLPLLLAGGCARYPYSFVDRYSPATGMATTVLGGPAGGGYVTDAILFPAS